MLCITDELTLLNSSVSHLHRHVACYTAMCTQHQTLPQSVILILAGEGGCEHNDTLTFMVVVVVHV